MHDQKCECECDFCKNGLEAEIKKQEAMLEKQGWLVHYITEFDEQSPTGFNCHTHGLLENFGHTDLQIVISLPHRIALDVLNSAVNRIREGVQLEDGPSYDKILEDLKVKFIKRKEAGRTVLRMILPPKNGLLARELMDSPKFEAQYD